MKDALVCSLSAVNPIRPLILWRQSSLSYFVLCQSSYVVPSPLIMALSSRTITASINYRCAPFSATLMHRSRRAALKTPSDACAEDCRGKLIWPRCPINACSPWCVPIITLPESVLTTKPRQRFSAVTCCTSNVNPPARFRGYDVESPGFILPTLVLAHQHSRLDNSAYFSSSTDKILPAGSLNHAINGPPPRNTPFSSVLRSPS